MMTTDTRCPICNGNDGDRPCAYTTEKPDGCLRAKRLEAEATLNAAVFARSPMVKLNALLRKIVPESDIPLDECDYARSVVAMAAPYRLHQHLHSHMLIAIHSAQVLQACTPPELPSLEPICDVIRKYASVLARTLVDGFGDYLTSAIDQRTTNRPETRHFGRAVVTYNTRALSDALLSLVVRAPSLEAAEIAYGAQTYFGTWLRAAAEFHQKSEHQPPHNK